MIHLLWILPLAFLIGAVIAITTKRKRKVAETIPNVSSLPKTMEELDIILERQKPKRYIPEDKFVRPRKEEDNVIRQPEPLSKIIQQQIDEEYERLKAKKDKPGKDENLFKLTFNDGWSKPDERPSIDTSNIGIDYSRDDDNTNRTSRIEFGGGDFGGGGASGSWGNDDVKQDDTPDSTPDSTPDNNYD